MTTAFDPRQTALLIVDLQNDFLHAKGAYARGGATNPLAVELPERLAPLARGLRERGGLVVASQFTLWPDAAGEPLIDEHLHRLRPFLRRGDFAAGSWGQQVVEPLQPWVAAQVQKVAYSAFYSTQLDWLLRRCGIRQLWVAGIVTQGGVASTARDGHTHGYRVAVLGDGCAAFSPEVHATALADLGNLVTVIDCGNAMTQLAPFPASP